MFFHAIPFDRNLPTALYLIDSDSTGTEYHNITGTDIITGIEYIPLETLLLTIQRKILPDIILQTKGISICQSGNAM